MEKSFNRNGTDEKIIHCSQSKIHQSNAQEHINGAIIRLNNEVQRSFDVHNHTNGTIIQHKTRDP